LLVPTSRVGINYILFQSILIFASIDMINTYSLKHNLDVRKFLFAYMAILNSMIRDIWDTIEWDEKPIKEEENRTAL
jgi:hypothetical protein